MKTNCLTPHAGAAVNRSSPSRRLRAIILALFGLVVGHGVHADELRDGFVAPPREHRPETLFHFIGGNVNKAGVTTDLEALVAAGIQGIQLFHGSGGAWPGVTPQIQTLSPSWDGMIRHVADETKRLGLRFTMQNCPGWAMSGGPWITPDKAMRHLVWSRHDLTGGKAVSVQLDRPQPSDEGWRDYREVAVLAFPTPADDDGGWLRPVNIRSNRKDADWSGLLDSSKKSVVHLAPGGIPAWVEIGFAQPTTLRTIELPPIENLMAKRIFDSDSHIVIQVADGEGWRELVRHTVPRGNWQDSLPEYPYVLAVPDASSTKYRLVFENNQRMELSYLRLSSAARSQDWRGQAGFALRSLERGALPVQARETWVESKAVVDLTGRMNATGQLTWNAPPGRWTVVRFGHVNTGAKNQPAPPEATGFECDKLAAAGAEQHFNGYIGRLTQTGGAADGGRLHGMQIDSWECFTQTWTPAMEQEFAARRAYALRRWLPALAGWVVDDHRTSERFLRDWRATLSDLLAEKYYGRLAELARARGMNLSFESAMGDVSPGDILQYLGRADIPMCEFWQPNDPHNGGLETKPIAPTASAARLYGKTRVAAESFTSYPLTWDVHPFNLKNLADRHFALGVTHIFFHTYTHNPLDRVPGTSFGGDIGSPFLRGQTWWKHMPHFTDYLARCGFMLERGRSVSDVLWYLGDDLDHKPRQDQSFPNGYHFDYLNADVLLNRLSVHDGRLQVPEGTSWRVIWLPREQCSRLTPATLGKLKNLLEAGATIIGEPPAVNPSLSGGAAADRQYASLVKELWGSTSEQTGERQIGKGRLLWGGELSVSLGKLGIGPDVVGTRSAMWCHRRDGDTDMYFVAADRLSPLNANLRFRASGIPEFWDALSGKTTPVAVFQQDASGTTIPMQIPAAGSVFVVFRPGVPSRAFERIAVDGTPWLDAMDAKRVDTGEPYPNFGLTRDVELQPWIEPAPMIGDFLPGARQFVAWKDGDYQFTRQGSPESHQVTGTRSLPLKEGWKLSFPIGWDAPATLELGELKPWSDLEDHATRHFSGSAIYRTKLRLEAPEADERVWLDLGRVAEIAGVRINGRMAAVLWTAPFRADITEWVQAGDNEIEIEITNSWHNRLAYDASLPEAGRKTWTICTPKANAPVKPAGLVGPVQVRVGKVVNLTLK